MKETGIIMSGNHPKLILDGIKTQSRRVIKPQPTFNGTDLNGKPYFIYKGEEYSLWALSKKCPYGQVGDRLWVRETWTTEKRLDYLSPSQIGEAGDVPVWWEASSSWEMASVGLEIGKWRPSIFMPRWASRITLEITEIRVERLQEISEEDARAEGIIWVTIETAPQSNVYRPCAVENFGRLWDSLNAKRGYGWEVNPWVWCLSFRMIDK